MEGGKEGGGEVNDREDEMEDGSYMTNKYK